MKDGVIDTTGPDIISPLCAWSFGAGLYAQVRAWAAIRRYDVAVGNLRSHHPRTPPSSPLGGVAGQSLVGTSGGESSHPLMRGVLRQNYTAELGRGRPPSAMTLRRFYDHGVFRSAVIWENITFDSTQQVPHTHNCYHHLQRWAPFEYE